MPRVYVPVFNSEGDVLPSVGGGGPGVFPEIDFGPDEFAGTGGDTLPVYSASNYATISGLGNPVIDATSGARSDAGSAFRASQVIGMANADHVDVVVGSNSDISSNDRYCGVVFKCSDATSSTTNGYFLQIYRVASGDRRGRLSLFTAGAPSTTLDETTALDVTTGDRVGVRFNADGTWQMYKSDDGGAWATTGTPGTDTTYTNSGGYWAVSESSVAILDKISIGTW